MNNRGVEALIRRSPVPLAADTRREARRAARGGLDIAPVMALSATLALRNGLRVVPLALWDAAVVTETLRRLDWGTDSRDSELPPA